MLPKLQLLEGYKKQSFETRTSQMSLLKCQIVFFSASILKMEDKVQSLLQESFSAICTLEKSHCGLSVSDKDFCCTKWKCRISKFSVCLATIASFWYGDSEVRLIFALNIAGFVSEVEIVREKPGLPTAEF